MGEIKGQILGVVMVLAIFGAVSAALYNAFSTASNDVKNQITSSTDPEKIKEGAGTASISSDDALVGNLTF